MRKSAFLKQIFTSFFIARFLASSSSPPLISEAVTLLEQDEVIKAALGTHIFEKFVEAKHAEYNEYRLAVHDWELKRYMSLL